MKRLPEASTATPVGWLSRAEVAGIAVDAEVRRLAAARDGIDHAGRADHADPVVMGIGDEEVAGGVHRDARGLR